MRPLRFCFVTTFYPPHHEGGDAIFVYRLAEALAALGHSVHVVYSLDAYRLRPHQASSHAFTHHANVARFPLETAHPRWSALASHQLGRPAVYASMLEAHFATHTYDVIHYHNVSLMGAPAVLRLGRAVKLYTTHEYWLVCPTHVLFKFDREACTSRACVRCTLMQRRPPQVWRLTGLRDDCLTQLDSLIMPSRFALERHRQDGVTAPMRVIPHFVPTADEEVDAGSRAVPARPYFLFVGRLEKLKGVQDLIALFRSYRDADLLIVGGGAYEEELRAMAEGLPHVRFTGTVHPSEVRQFYAQATAVLTPSLCYEVFPMAAAEALAVGTPVIGRRLGGLQEVIESSGGGITFDTLDECRAAMTRLLNDPSARAAYAERGRAFARTHWTLDAHLRQYFALIAEKQAASASAPT